MTFYDASHISLAQKERSKLVTADKSLCRNLPETIALLEELKL